MVATEERIVTVTADGLALEGSLAVPECARGVVLFAHGSGSSRHSPRNRYVAGVLRASGLGTLLIDLLTVREEAADARTGHLRFDIELLAGRVGTALDWLTHEPTTRGRPIGLFGASTGAAAAFVAAAARPTVVGAVVSRGGRPDLAGDALGCMRAPALLIVGGADDLVIDLNRQALERLQGTNELAIVPGASHLFEEAGALEEVARLAAGWFVRHIGAPASARREGG